MDEDCPRSAAEAGARWREWAGEFVWLMQRYQACSRKDIETLLGTPAMEKLMATERSRLAALAGSLPESLMS